MVDGDDLTPLLVLVISKAVTTFPINPVVFSYTDNVFIRKKSERALGVLWELILQTKKAIHSNEKTHTVHYAKKSSFLRLVCF